MESRTIDLASIHERYKMAIASEKCLSGARPNPDQILEPHGSVVAMVEAACPEADTVQASAMSTSGAMRQRAMNRWGN
jgi:hypothetical protein